MCSTALGWQRPTVNTRPAVLLLFVREAEFARLPSSRLVLPRTTSSSWQLDVSSRLYYHRRHFSSGPVSGRFSSGSFLTGLHSRFVNVAGEVLAEAESESHIVKHPRIWFNSSEVNKSTNKDKVKIKTLSTAMEIEPDDSSPFCVFRSLVVFKDFLSNFQMVSEVIRLGPSLV